MSSGSDQLLWAEKYRPRRLRDIADLELIVRRLESFVEKKNVPNLLFVGPPGTAKTSAALCLAYELFGERAAENTLELNASDERGIQTVREIIKDFARSRSVGEAVPFKLLILDECDNMTNDAQQALRRTMEKYASTCRFILIANFQGGIIEPIQSRCAVFRFSPFPDEVVVEQVRRLARMENVSFDEEGLKEVARQAEGDMRKAINIAEAAAAASGEITATTVNEVTGRSYAAEVEKMLKAELEGDHEGAAKILRQVLAQTGYSGRDVVREVHRRLGSLEISEKDKLRLIEAAAEADYRLSLGADPEIQLEGLLARAGLASRERGAKKGGA
ncbi:MAG: replication factor C small subunit [Candidatus Brockarchaeota archaeon]|nr:replication factor C small subunit [Candidatus Brockarchaeota archaeon]